MPPRAFVVVNPAAGTGRTERMWAALRDRLHRAGLEFEWAATTAPGAGIALARQAAGAGIPLVVAVGGDGTFHEAVNGVMGPDGRALAAVGAILTGRGRDACRNFGIARDPTQAADRLGAGSETLVDLGVAEWPGGRRYFAIAASAGFDAEVARRAQTRRGPGTVPYLLTAIATLPAHRAQTVTVTSDHGTWKGLATAVVVSNAPYYGGGIKMAPGAAPDDGELDVILRGDIGPLQALLWLPSIYVGLHLRHPRVTAFRSRCLSIDADPAWPAQLDGEPVARTPLRIEVRPAALRLYR